MSGPPYDLWSALRRCRTAWAGFFLSPQSTWPCAWVRIGYALVVLVNLACWYPDLVRWFGDDGILAARTLPLLQTNTRWTLLAWLPGDAWTLTAVWAVFLLGAICLLLGAGSRISAAIVLLGLISFQNRNPVILDGEDTLLRLMGWYVLLMPCGRAFALDRWLWRREACWGAGVAPVWALRLLQLNVAMVFLTAAWFKLQGETWRNGLAMYYVSRLDDYFGRFPMYDWPWDTPWVLFSISWAVIVIEFVVPLLVWFRQTRLLALAGTLVFHLANEYTMNLFMFHWVMLIAWSAFLLPEDFVWRRRRAAAAPFESESRSYAQATFAPSGSVTEAGNIA